MTIQEELTKLLAEIKTCKVCESHLSHGVRPVLTGQTSAKIVIIGQAPGIRVHRSGIPWNDPSGDRLRTWMGIDKATFYDDSQIAIVPMGFCYPGKGKSGDLPPRKECAPLWHERVFNHLPNIELIMLVGSYAQKHYLKKQMERNMTETVKVFHNYLPKYLPLVHPSPRNRYWLTKNPWFEKDVIPYLQNRINDLLVKK